MPVASSSMQYRASYGELSRRALQKAFLRQLYSMLRQLDGRLKVVPSAVNQYNGSLSLTEIRPAPIPITSPALETWSLYVHAERSIGDVMDCRGIEDVYELIKLLLDCQFAEQLNPPGTLPILPLLCNRRMDASMYTVVYDVITNMRDASDLVGLISGCEFMLPEWIALGIAVMFSDSVDETVFDEIPASCSFDAMVTDYCQETNITVDEALMELNREIAAAKVTVPEESDEALLNRNTEQRVLVLEQLADSLTHQLHQVANDLHSQGIEQRQNKMVILTNSSNRPLLKRRHSDASSGSASPTDSPGRPPAGEVIEGPVVQPDRPLGLPRRKAERRVMVAPTLAGDTCAVRRRNSDIDWIPGKVVSVEPSQPSASAKFTVNISTETIVVPGTCVAQGAHPAGYILPDGMRVVAAHNAKQEITEEGGEGAGKRFVSGFIAEIPSAVNKFRYLVFFDDGYAQYCRFDQVHAICYASRDPHTNNIEPWRDVPATAPQLAEFVEYYMGKYPSREMIRLRPAAPPERMWNDRIRVMRDGGMVNAEVVELDCSLFRLEFDEDKSTEWIYRGSWRLGPLIDLRERTRLDAERHRLRRRKALPRNTVDCMEYDTFADADANQTKVNDEERLKKVTLLRAVERCELKAKKRSNNHCIMRKLELPPTKFTQHDCSSACLSAIPGAAKETYSFLGENPLMIPLLCGWDRCVCTIDKSHTECRWNISQRIVYRAPCGRSIRTAKQLSAYLRSIGSTLPEDYFTFDYKVNPLREYHIDDRYRIKEDISNGAEKVAIPAFDIFKKSAVVPSLALPCITYIRTRQTELGKGGNSEKAALNLNENGDFVLCCECTDGCSNAEECACQRNTIESTRIRPNDKENRRSVYNHRRIQTKDARTYGRSRSLHIVHCISGMYECNAGCACKRNCANRVAQNEMDKRLMSDEERVDKGWGVIARDDIPKGSFICTYAGEVLTDQAAEDRGRGGTGDEYFAELDLIEQCEDHKEGYEESVAMLDTDDSHDSETTTESQAEFRKAKDMEKLRKDERKDEMHSSGSEDSSICNYVCFGSFIDRDLKWEDDLKYDTDKSRVLKEDLLKKLDEVVGRFTDFLNLSSKPQARVTSLERVRTQRVGVRTFGDVEEAAQVRNAVQILFRMELPFSSYRDWPEKSKVASNFQCFAASAGCDSWCVFTFQAQERPLRSFYGEHDSYVIDAKMVGNVGRFLNHSCAPNVEPVHVFINTHDLRFPTVAFFARERIEAGQELCWDYNYEVNSVAGREIQCACGAAECRNRLL